MRRPTRRSAWPLLGLAAQGLAFASSMVPIVLGQTALLVQIVVVMAAVSATVTSAGLCIGARLPVVVNDNDARKIIRASCVSILTVAAAVTVLGLGIFGPEPMITGFAVLFVGQGFYQVTVARRVRHEDYSSIMLMRVAYGTTTFVVTCCVGLFFPSTLAYLMALTGGYIAAVLVASWRSGTRDVAASLESESALSYRTAFLGAWRLALAQLFTGLSGQVGALATASMGPFAEPWAVSVRLTAGFQTVASQVVAPSVDIAVGRSRRAGLDLRPAVNRSRRLGYILSALATPVILPISLSFQPENFTTEQIIVLCIGIIGYQMTALLMAPSERVLGLLDRPIYRLRWDTVRLCALGVVLTLPGPAWMLLWLGLVGAIANLSYMALCHRAARLATFDGRSPRRSSNDESF